MRKRLLQIGLMFFGMWLLATLGPGAAPVTAQNRIAEAFLEGLGPEPTLGSKTAPVAIVEFSDFQCGYCRVFWQETLPKLKSAYITGGKLRFTYRHFAVLGKPSEHAALASECAAEQGRFWAYHDKLFQNQRAALFTEANLKRFAAEIGVRVRDFGACFGGGRHKDKIERETATAAYLGGRGTPLFFINGRSMPGAQPYAVFEKLIEQELQNRKP